MSRLWTMLSRDLLKPRAPQEIVVATAAGLRAVRSSRRTIGRSAEGCRRGVCCLAPLLAGLAAKGTGSIQLESVLTYVCSARIGVNLALSLPRTDLFRLLIRSERAARRPCGESKSVHKG